MDELRLGFVQMSHGGSQTNNLTRVESLIRQAVNEGAKIIVSPELLEGPYFCQTEDSRYFDWAEEAGKGEGFALIEGLAKELDVVLTYSFFERAGQSYFNSLALFDADQGCKGIYRKSHIPGGPGYEEKFYFNPGDTGLRVFSTKWGRVGMAVCWDQWFPEVARILALQGAECLLYPTAIGSEPEVPDLDTCPYWMRVMQGHAAANRIPVVASNRYGKEVSSNGTGLVFYGSSFITDDWGEVVEKAPRKGDAIGVAVFSRSALQLERANWGFFRDRRPDLYGPLLTLDGKSK